MTMTWEEIFPTNRPRRLSAADIERLATIDASDSMSKGKLRAISDRSTDPTDPARPLLDALLAVPVADVPPAPYANPAHVDVPPGSAGDKRPLTPADLEWLRRLPTDPAKVSAEDVTTLATMVQQASSSSDLRLLAAHFRPVWDHHDVAEQQHERQVARQAAETAKGARNRTVEHLAVQALTAHVQQEHPQLRAYEARNRAADQLRDRWADVDLELQARIDAAPTWPAPNPRSMPGAEGLDGMAVGRERAQRARERQDAAPGPFNGLRIIGG